jgi:putative ABC transport system permease protein
MKFFSFIVKNLFRNTRRTLLTMLALSISFFLYCAIFTLIAGMYQRLSRENADLNLILRPKYMANFVDAQLPAHYLQKLRDVPLVATATPYKMYVGKGRSENKSVFVVGVDPYAIDGIRTLALRDPKSIQEFRQRPQGALVGEIVLSENHWRLGDSIIIKGVRNVPPLSLEIVGVMQNTGDLGAAVLTHYTYIRNLMDGNGDMSVIFFRAAMPYQVPWLVRSVDKAFESASVAVEVITEKSFLRSVLSELEGVVTAVKIVAWVAVVATIGIVSNTLSMAIRERKREIGVFRTLGFSQWILSLLFLGEAMILSGVGGLFGAGMAWAIFRFGDIRISTGMGSSAFNILPQGTPVMQSLILALAVGFVSSVVPAVRFCSKPITENLASVD